MSSEKKSPSEKLNMHMYYRIASKDLTMIYSNQDHPTLARRVVKLLPHPYPWVVDEEIVYTYIPGSSLDLERMRTKLAEAGFTLEEEV